MSFDNRGMSLIEVLIAGALLAALAVGGMTLFKNQTTAQKTIEQNYEVVTVLSQMRTILSDQSNCSSSFIGRDPDSGLPTINNLVSIVNGVNNNVFAVNSLLPGNVKVLSYKLAKTGFNVATNETILLIEFSRGTNTLKDQIRKTLKLVYTVDGTGKILTCYAISNQTDSFWIQSTNDPNDIYYTGEVGIGNTNPDSSLHVFKDFFGVQNKSAVHVQGIDAGSVNTDIYILQKGPTGGFSDFALINAVAGGASKFSVRGDGKVGINTPSPTHPLTIHASEKHIKIQDNENGDGLWSIGTVGTDNTGLNFIDDDVNVRMTITETGNVGISNPNPAAKLDVNGDVISRGTFFGKFSCRFVVGPAGLNGSTASCNGNEFVLNGGGSCTDGTQGYIHHSAPCGNAWCADCYRRGGGDIEAVAYATCCKMTP